MIIPNGGITKDGLWKYPKTKDKYLFCVNALSKVYRGKFMEKLNTFLKAKNQQLSIRLKEVLYNKEWVVYAKDAFGGPNQVLEYLGRYSHKIAISNNRIKKVENGKVSFSYKDYADDSKQKLMCLDAEEFLRRFCMHILPQKFMKIRHYGILASRVKPKLKLLQMMMGVVKPKKEKTDTIAIGWKEITKTKMGFDVDACPCCKTGKMQRILSFNAHAPPPTINNKLKPKMK